MRAILRRIILGVISLAVMAAAACILVVSAAYALFAIFRQYLGSVGASALVALFAAAAVALLGMAVGQLALGRPAIDSETPETPVQRLVAMAKDRPIVSVGALIGAAAVAIRNPAITALVVKAFLDQSNRTQKRKAKT